MSAAGGGLRWVLAGGGTGGHVMPALALAERLREAGEAVLFLGAQRGLETRLVPDAGFELVALDARPVIGQGLLGRARSALALAGSTLAARKVLREFGADRLIAVGGYAAVPGALAARLCGIPMALLEANAVPGLANRAMARFASLLFVGFEPAAARLGRGAGDPRVRVTGLPLRRSLVEAFEPGAPRREPAPPLRLFVFGGSQGARQINDAMLEALTRLDRSRLAVVHQTGGADRERVARSYAQAGVAAEVVAFERDMAARYRWADLVVCRAGALTVAELGLAGRASILVPLAHVGGGEQAANARVLEALGAARVLEGPEELAPRLAAAIEELGRDPKRLVEMGERAAETARPDAAEAILDACRGLGGSRDRAASARIRAEGGGNG